MIWICSNAFVEKEILKWVSHKTTTQECKSRKLWILGASVSCPAFWNLVLCSYWKCAQFGLLTFCCAHNKGRRGKFIYVYIRIQTSTIYYFVAVSLIELHHRCTYTEWDIVNLCFLILCCVESNVNTMKNKQSFQKYMVGLLVWIWFRFWQLLSKSLWCSIWVASFANQTTRTISVRLFDIVRKIGWTPISTCIIWNFQCY